MIVDIINNLGVCECGYIKPCLFASGFLVPFIVPQLVVWASGIPSTFCFNVLLLLTLHRPPLLPVGAALHEDSHGCLALPLCHFSLYTISSFCLWCVSISLSLVHSPSLPHLPADLEQSCLSKVECGYRIEMRRGTIFIYLFVYFFGFVGFFFFFFLNVCQSWAASELKALGRCGSSSYAGITGEDFAAVYPQTHMHAD